jgi:hypothetical protein
MEDVYSNFPQFEQIFEDNNIIIQDAIDEGGQALIDDNTLYTIPIVVHVLHLGVNHVSNISDAQINNAILQLNSDFENGGNENEVNIQFCLAQRDPQNNPTTGILRTNASSLASYNSLGISIGGNEMEVKDFTEIWPNNMYINIWIVHDIANDQPNAQAYGYATFPKSDPSIDGIVIQYDAMGTPEQSKVITHEMGHYFQLYHTFQSSPNQLCSLNDPCDNDDSNNNTEVCCITTGDRCCDTESHSQTFGCPETITLSCGEGINPPVIHNHMSYTNNACKDHFTQDQILRMRCALIEIRSTLTLSKGCEESCGPFVSGFSVDQDDLFTSFSADNQDAGTSYIWQIGNNILSNNQNSQSTNISLPTEYTVCLTTLSELCSEVSCKNVIQTDVINICPINNICEKVFNGNFEENNVDGWHHFQETVREFNIVCGWYNFIRSPFFCSDQINGDYIGFIAPNEIVSTFVDLDLIDGGTYQISFDYFVDKRASENMLDQLYAALSTTKTFSSFNNITKIKTINDIQSQDITNVPGNNAAACAIENFNFIPSEPLEFTYSSSMGQYLVFGGENSGGITVYIDNVNISQCIGPCSPDLDIEVEADGCSYSFNVIDNGIADHYSWAVTHQNGDIYKENGFQTGEESHVIFSEPGIYTICVFATCGAGGSSKCITINVDEGCDLNCDFIIPITNGSDCGYDSKTYSESIRIPKNLDLCPGTVEELVDGIEVISIEVYTGDPDFNFLNLVLGEFELGQTLQIMLCNETGGVSCYTFQTIADEVAECISCIELAPSTAVCDPNNNPLDGISNYTGSFSIPFILLENNLCGITSDIAGFSIESINYASGSTIIQYSIGKNNSDSFTGTVSICELFDNICLYLTINAVGCDEYDCPQLIILTGECSSVDEITGMASFGFTTILSGADGSSIDDLLSEYSICSQDDIFLEGGIINNVTITPFQGQKGYWNIGIMADISCDVLESGDVKHDLNILMCNDMGDEVCISFEIEFECDACKDIDSGKRNNVEYQGISSIYPNPASNKVTVAIASKNIKKPYSYILYNHLGMKILSEGLINEINEINLSNVMDGIYFISILENGLIIENHKIILIK